MKNRRTFHPLAAVLAAALLTAPCGAIADDGEDPNTGAITFTLDDSFTTAYMFRGIVQERDGLIWQPSIGIGVHLFDSEDGVVQSVDLGFGLWMSVHSEDTGSSGSGPDALYETDYYPSLSVAWAGGVTSTLTYYWYTSPNNAFRTVEEVAIDLAYDDSELLGAFAMNPTASFVFETNRSSFGGNGKGAVFELGLEPGAEFTLPMDEAEEYPISVTVPFKMGLSMDDYYRTGSEDDTFGYARLGLHASIPIACVPSRYGAWSITNGFDVYFLGDTLENVNQHDEVYPVWTSSLTLDY